MEYDGWRFAVSTISDGAFIPCVEVRPAGASGAPMLVSWAKELGLKVDHRLHGPTARTQKHEELTKALGGRGRWDPPAVCEATVPAIDLTPVPADAARAALRFLQDTIPNFSEVVSTARGERRRRYSRDLRGSTPQAAAEPGPEWTDYRLSDGRLIKIGGPNRAGTMKLGAWALLWHEGEVAWMHVGEVRADAQQNGTWMTSERGVLPPVQGCGIALAMDAHIERIAGGPVVPHGYRPERPDELHLSDAGAKYWRSHSKQNTWRGPGPAPEIKPQPRMRIR